MNTQDQPQIFVTCDKTGNQTKLADAFIIKFLTGLKTTTLKRWQELETVKLQEGFLADGSIISNDIAAQLRNFCEGDGFQQIKIVPLNTERKDFEKIRHTGAGKCFKTGRKTNSRISLNDQSPLAGKPISGKTAGWARRLGYLVESPLEDLFKRWKSGEETLGEKVAVISTGFLSHQLIVLANRFSLSKNELNGKKLTKAEHTLLLEAGFENDLIGGYTQEEVKKLLEEKARLTGWSELSETDKLLTCPFTGRAITGRHFTLKIELEGLNPKICAWAQVHYLKGNENLYQKADKQEETMAKFSFKEAARGVDLRNVGNHTQGVKRTKVKKPKKKKKSKL